MTGSHDDDPDGRHGQEPRHDTPYWPFGDQPPAGDDDPTASHPSPDQPPMGYPPPDYSTPVYGTPVYGAPDYRASEYSPPEPGTPGAGPGGQPPGYAPTWYLPLDDTGYGPPSYGPGSYGGGPGGPGQGPPQPPPGHRTPSPFTLVVVVVAVLGALVAVFALGTQTDDTSSATPSPTVTGVTVLPPLPTTTRRSVPPSTAPSTPPSRPPTFSTGPSRTGPPRTVPPTTTAVPPGTALTIPPGAAAPGLSPSPSQTAQISALGAALVTAIGDADQASLTRLTCGPLAEELSLQPTEPDPTVLERVDNIRVSSDGAIGTMDVWAYTMGTGPPATQVTFQVQLVNGAWRACDYSY
ncbi:hypothetical protein [Rhodococcus sp. X156]|uniref:hypothetical protein n=1 Tax=Rhodococcus sp. X156 TaxID=2499145 RepID=UPI000FDC4578|nr:hypothetical protein [Rhodococcus sp. X156]